MTVEDHKLLDAGGTETSLFHTNVQRHKPLIYKDTSLDHVLYHTLHASAVYEFREHTVYFTKHYAVDHSTYTGPSTPTINEP